MKRLCKFNVIINLNKVIKIITAIRIKKCPVEFPDTLSSFLRDLVTN